MADIHPVQDFVTVLLPRVDEQHWWGFDEKKPPGGYLVRFEHDITGDGRSEVFVASSLEADEEAYSWTIYSPDSEQSYSTIASGVTIPPHVGFYLVSGPKRELQTVYSNPKFGVATIERYSIQDRGALTHNKQELTGAQVAQLGADDWKKTFTIGDEVKPEVSKVLLAEYALNRAVEWRRYNPELGVLGQNSDPADSVAIAAHADFSLQTAKQLAGRPVTEK